MSVWEVVMMCGSVAGATAVVCYILTRTRYETDESRASRAYFRLTKARRYLSEFSDINVALDWIMESGGAKAHPDIRALRDRIRKARVEEEEQRIIFDRKGGFR